MSNISQPSKVFVSLDSWVTRRELNSPLPPADVSCDDQAKEPDCSLPMMLTTRWERFLFRIYTGLDLQKVREWTVAHSPRFEQLASMTDNGTIREARSACTKVLMDGYHINNLALEHYWVDRELSARIVDLPKLQAILNNDPQFSDSYCRESIFKARVTARLWKLKRQRQKKDRLKAENPSKSSRDDKNWEGKVLGERLAEDIERRKRDPHCRLFFAYNERYEEQLRDRIRLVNTCWAATVAALAMLGAAIFYAKSRL